MSLFKKSASQEEGFTRSSGKGKRRSAKDKKLDHREQFEDILLVRKLFCESPRPLTRGSKNYFEPVHGRITFTLHIQSVGSVFPTRVGKHVSGNMHPA